MKFEDCTCQAPVVALQLMLLIAVQLHSLEIDQRVHGLHNQTPAVTFGHMFLCA